MDYQSPNHQKIKELNDKLKELDQEDRLSSRAAHEPRLQNLEWRLHGLGQKIKKASSKDDSKYRQLEVEICGVEDTLKIERRDFDNGMADRDESIREIQKRIGEVVSQLDEEMREEKGSIGAGLEEKVTVVKQEYGENTRVFRELCQKRRMEIGARVEEVRESMDNERKSRDETSEFLIKSFGEEILKLQELLNIEKTSRMRANKEAMSLINDIEDSLNDQIREQKAVKARNQDIFTKLLEETCYKIQQSFLE